MTIFTGGELVELVGAAVLVVGAVVITERATRALLDYLPTTSLSSYSIDLTMLAEKGKLDPVVGREKQIEHMIQILGRRRKNNPCLVGEAGVGKTAIAEGLAQRIVSGDVPNALKKKRVIALDLGLIVAGTVYRGQLESRMKGVLNEISRRKDVIVFIDEIHTLIGAGGCVGGLNASNMLKPALARGQLQCIGATTLVEYRKYIEKDAALERRFQSVVVPESSVTETIQILNGLREFYESHHELRYTDEALVAAAHLSSQYISDRYLPDKAIDLVDEAGSRARQSWARKPAEDQDGHLIVTDLDVQRVVSSWIGIPVENVSADESVRLLNLEEVLRRSVVGQDEAVGAISNAIRRARAGLKNPNRPIASFIFCGPTGVGKSELAKALAVHYFGSKEAMIRLDMSEFMERHTVSKLIGSPPGYLSCNDGGQLTEAVRRRPYTVVLFDEIEKAHRDVDNLLLQILEDGRLTDGKGRTVDFKNTVVLLTSNVGSRAIVNGGGRSDDEIKKLVAEELKGCFRPEFLNRLDDTIIFKQLTRVEVKEIADMMVKEVVERVKAKKIEVRVAERLRERVVEEGFSPSYGARPLRRAITRLLEDRLATKLLTREVKEGDSVVVDVDIDGNVIVVNESSSSCVGTN